METWLWNRLNPEWFSQTVLILVLLGGAIWLKWPEIKKRVSEGPLKEKAAMDTDESLTVQVRELNRRVFGIEEKLANDYARINRLERENDQIMKLAEASLEERGILMECTLAELKALQGMGANGATGIKQAQKKLEEYLNHNAHKIGFERSAEK